MADRILGAPVGIGQPNSPDDVRQVQHLLNQHLGSTAAGGHLAEDGAFGPRTEARLVQYQRDAVRLGHPDGVADPHGPTMRSLSHGSGVEAGQARRVDPDANLHVSDYVARHPVTHGHETAETRAWIERALPAAQAVHERWGVPVSVTIAQGALESGWGTRHPGNEYFGVKGHAPDGQSMRIATHEESGGKSHAETDSFRSYGSLEQSADDYGRFLVTNKRYAEAFRQTDDPHRFVHEVAKAGYATESNYERQVRSIMDHHDLTRYDAAPGRNAAPQAPAPQPSVSAADARSHDDPRSYWQDLARKGQDAMSAREAAQASGQAPGMPQANQAVAAPAMRPGR